MLKNVFLVCLLFTAGTSYGEVIVRAPIAGTGTYNLVPNGNFNAGIGGWSMLASEPYGGMTWNSSNGFNGAGAITANPTVPRSGPGFAYLQTITGLVAGQTYILSGAFNADTLGAGQLYLDMTDAVGGDTGIRPIELGIVPSGWFFAYKDFIPNGTSANLRIIRDRYGDDLSSGGFVDEIGVTPISSFVAPISAVPEPNAITLLVLASGIIAYSHRRKVNRMVRV